MHFAFRRLTLIQSILGIISLLLLSSASHANNSPALSSELARLSTPSEFVPSSLVPWQPWVLRNDTHIQCPFINQQGFGAKSAHVCAWGSPLQLSLNETGGTFTQRWQIYRSTQVPLPGNSDVWPSQVLVNGQSAIIAEKNNTPFIYLDAGAYEISGRFNYQQIPTRMPIDERIGIVQLQVNNEPVMLPRRQGGFILLDSQREVASTANSIDIDVARKVTDGAYINLETHITLSVAGEPREVTLGKVMPKDFDLVNIKSDLPSFLDADGLLHVQVKQGVWVIELSAYAKPNTLVWSRPNISHIWPNEEVWVIDTNETLRSGKIEGAPFVDATQTLMPKSWIKYPSYLLSAKDVLTYDIKLRGKPLNDTNDLSLSRDFWLSFDHKSMYFVDTIQGNMIQDWRLSMRPPYSLESADDRDNPLLITQLKTQESGFETRYPRVNITARGKVPLAQLDEVSGWEQGFEQVRMSLNLPPGTLLFNVSDVDYVSKSWVSNWSIWQSFIVLFTAIIAFRLFGAPAGVLTLFMLVLNFQESHAPVFLIVNVLLAFAAKKHIRFEKLKKWVSGYLVVSLALLSIAALYFTAMQIRSVVYPQLESRLSTYQGSEIIEVAGIRDTVQQSIIANRLDEIEDDTFVENIGQTSNQKTADALSRVTGVSVSKPDAERARVTARGTNRNNNLNLIAEKYQADAILQTGAGIPDWQWKSYQLRWDGAVSAQQTFGLFVLSKNQYRMLKLLGIALLGLWFVLITRVYALALLSKLKPALAPCVLISLGVLLPSHNDAHAQQLQSANPPSQEVLAELRSWLIQPPTCAPNCALIQSVTLDELTQQSATLRFSVHAQTKTAIALPKSQAWLPRQVSINGDPATQLFTRDGWTYTVVEKGVSTIGVSGRVAPISSWQIAFKQQPKSIKLDENMIWTVNGVNQGKMIGKELEFVSKENTALFARQSEENQSNENTAKQQSKQKYASTPLVSVTRLLVFEQKWTIQTRVQRIAPTTGSINIKVPLLDGEFVTTNDITVQDGFALISIGSNNNSLSYTSSLNRADTLVLASASEHNIVDQWQVVSSPSWHLTMSGVPEVLSILNPNDYYIHNYYPYPDESLHIDIFRPEPIKGESIAIDEVRLKLTNSKREKQVNLAFTYRTNRGGTHTISLPEEYELKRIAQNGVNLNIEAKGTQLSLPILPGNNQIVINMSANEGYRLQQVLPIFDLNAPTSNIYVSTHVTNQRWTLWTSGPTIGPAILYWGELLAFIVIALVVSRFRFSPLNTISWVLLGLGLSLQNWGVLVLSFIWFAAVYASTFRAESTSAKMFNLSQVALYALSGVAIIALILSIPTSLLSSPNMGIAGNADLSIRGLSWFADFSDGVLPSVTVVSVPNYVYKGLMLLWVIWLSFSLIKWLKWVWQKLGVNGYWKRVPKKPAPSDNNKSAQQS
jgi:hypothetical protein